MRVDTTPRVTLTWAQMDEILRRLGYVKQPHKEALIYHDKTTDALLLYPLKLAEERVDPPHLTAARFTSYRFGIVETEEDFDRVLFSVVGANTPVAA
jgi:hypothetical protein